MNQPRNTTKCPECGEWAEIPVVGIGVGEQQCGPASCESCGWIEPIPEEPEWDELEWEEP